MPEPILSPNLLPAPFETCLIPAGEVTLRKGAYLKKPTTFTLPTFAMAKYPITNAQYRQFIRAGGYRKAEWWTAAGWQLCQKQGWTAPRYGRHPRFQAVDQPVVGLSWYEALAFCHWLQDLSQMVISLPSEQQWQRAAQGDEPLPYPWGQDWDGSRCRHSVNLAESEALTQPSSVIAYTGLGDSPFGVSDMAGNVWEWCLTDYRTGANQLEGNNTRCVRGGSWFNLYPKNFRTDFRGKQYPQYRAFHLGFRIVCSTIAST